MQYKTFCAANSGEGFISLFDTLLDEKKNRIYYIKGGPGSGKSTLLKQLAQHAETAELIYCSGDPVSLDGIVLPEQGTVVIDATAPHSYEPHYPGVGGSIVDLGEGWEPEKLNKEKIMELTDRKKEIYKSCYALLKGAKSIHEGVFTPLAGRISAAKYQAVADKILRQNALWEQRGHPAAVQHRFLSGISPEGCITLQETFLSLGKNIILLDDRWMVGHLMLAYLDRRLRENGIDHINGYHPLLGKSTLQHIIIPQANLSVVSRDGIFPPAIPEDCVLRKITTQSMIEKTYLDENKNKLAFIKRLERELLHLACEKLEEARTLHMEIEKEYAKGMNFDTILPLKEKIRKNIFSQT